MTNASTHSLDSAAAAPSGRHALLAGATGLVGRQCLLLLLQEPSVTKVRVLLRRAISPAELLGPNHTLSPAQQGKLEVCVANFDALSDHPEWFAVDEVFCALGTTMAQAGSQAAFRRVDFDYPLSIAKLAKAQGARHFLLVSALGADARSRIFYSRVKGELEQAIQALGFASFTAARPALLAGHRKEFRMGEALALKLACITPPAYKPESVRKVAQGLVASAQQPPLGHLCMRVIDNIALRDPALRAQSIAN